MREFKFRAWDGEIMRYNTTPWQHDFVIDRTHWKCLIGGVDVGQPATFKVDGYLFTEVMQYTGLKDKNGKEIYEGDVLRNIDHVKYMVGWHAPSFWLFDVESPIQLLVGTSVWEIIGNVYENPTLLKASADQAGR